MSEALGPLDYRDGRGHSPDVARLVDTEIRQLVDQAGQLASDLLTKTRPQLDAVASALLERETLTGTNLAALLATR